MTANDLLLRLTLDMEYDKFKEEIGNICLELQEFSRISNIKEMDSTYQKLRERVKKHKQFIRDLRDETNQ